MKSRDEPLPLPAAAMVGLPAEPEIAACDALLAAAPAEAAVRLAEMAQALRTQQRPFVLGYALAALARATALTGEPAAARAQAEEARALFRQLGSAGGQAAALHALALSHAYRGEPATALELLNEALPLARRDVWPDLAARSANTLGVVYSDMGRHAQALQVLEHALADAAQAPAPRLRIRIGNNMALALARLALSERDAGAPEGEWRAHGERAWQLAQECVQACRAQFAFELASVLDSLALACVVLDRDREALAALDEAEPLLIAAGNHWAQVFSAATRARALLKLGDARSAVDAAQHGLAAAERAGVAVYVDELHRLLSLAWEACGEYREALLAHRRFHAQRSRYVLERAEEQARLLAVTLDTERAQRESRQDPLTGLANRRRFDEHLARLLPRARADGVVAVVLIDLDHFKQLNDRFGHGAGDEALRLLADVMRGECREGDLPARLGGDEFACILSGARGAARSLGVRLRRRLADASVARWAQGPRPTASIGLAETDAPCAPEALVAAADRSLYAVKAAGRNAVGD